MQGDNIVKPAKTKFIAVCLISLFLTANVWTQTAAFNYQGRLNDNNNPANGNYEMQFKLFDALMGGAQIGGTVSYPTVAVNSGVFSVSLDFGSAAFPGTDRFLEISLRPAGNPNSHRVFSKASG